MQGKNDFEGSPSTRLAADERDGVLETRGLSALFCSACEITPVSWVPVYLLM